MPAGTDFHKKQKNHFSRTIYKTGWKKKISAVFIFFLILYICACTANLHVFSSKYFLCQHVQSN